MNSTQKSSMLSEKSLGAFITWLAKTWLTANPDEPLLGAFFQSILSLDFAFWKLKKTVIQALFRDILQGGIGLPYSGTFTWCYLWIFHWASHASILLWTLLVSDDSINAISKPKWHTLHKELLLSKFSCYTQRPANYKFIFYLLIFYF